MFEVDKVVHTPQMVANDRGLQAFTDGSFKRGVFGGYGVFIPRVSMRLACGRRANDDLHTSSTITFELLGLLRALEICLEMEWRWGLWEPIFVYTDSYDSLTLLEMYVQDPIALGCHPNADVIQTIVWLAGTSLVPVHFCKVKGHYDIAGNQVADELAKIGAHLLAGQSQFINTIVESPYEESILAHPPLFNGAPGHFEGTEIYDCESAEVKRDKCMNKTGTFVISIFVNATLSLGGVKVGKPSICTKLVLCSHVSNTLMLLDTQTLCSALWMRLSGEELRLWQERYHMVQHQLISEACCVPVFIPQFPYIACRPAWTDSSNHLSVALRNAHMLSENGELYTWGKNRDYQLGIPGLKDEQLDPVPLQFPQALHDKTPVEVLGVSCGANHRVCSPDNLPHQRRFPMTWQYMRRNVGACPGLFFFPARLDRSRGGLARFRGLFASRPVRAGERVLEISLDLMIAPTRLPDQLSTLQSSAWAPYISCLPEPAELDNTVLDYRVFVSQKFQLQSSAWAPYISCLPEPAELDNTFLWEDTELSYLRASPLYGKTRERLEIITTEFGQVQNALDVWPQLFGKVSVEDFMHVYATVFSRPLAIGEDSTLVMIPMLDFFNHNAASFAKLSFNGLLNYAVVTADRDCAENDQIWINCGDLSNAELALDYGFTVPENRYDEVMSVRRGVVLNHFSQTAD
ncbi:hypothetical protein SELMODRAFT_432653 [Selaginella moellendorffii]|uniref:RNase H type-1 domain-containing protein n=1 Tax=Selaginella moellendorffii TaxID=88036 RepID=D8TGN6_SELML|nr:hypothetical protein SELMODRAFT_432653 [Selaginella moellendorffii]